MGRVLDTIAALMMLVAVWALFTSRFGLLGLAGAAMAAAVFLSSYYANVIEKPGRLEPVQGHRRFLVMAISAGLLLGMGTISWLMAWEGVALAATITIAGELALIAYLRRQDQAGGAASKV